MNNTYENNCQNCCFDNAEPELISKEIRITIVDKSSKDLVSRPLFTQYACPVCRRIISVHKVAQ